MPAKPKKQIAAQIAAKPIRIDTVSNPLTVGAPDLYDALRVFNEILKTQKAKPIYITISAEYRKEDV